MMRISPTALRCVSRMRSVVPNGVFRSVSGATSTTTKSNWASVWVREQVNTYTKTSIPLSMKIQNCATYCTTTEKPTKDEGTERQFSSVDKKYTMTDVVLTNNEKRKLVWTGFYKSFAEVPDRVSDAKLHRAMDLWRIYTNVAAGIFMTIILVVAIRQGQKHRARRIGELEAQAQDHVLGHHSKANEETAATTH